MSLQIADNFSYKGKKPLDARLVCNDIPDMLALPTSTIYDGIIVYVVAQKKFYTYDSNNTVDPTLQQWRELTTAGILIQSAAIDNVTTSATKGHLILTMSDGTTIDCGDAKGDKGDKGDGFAIIKLYTNVSDMTSDTNPVNDGQMVAVIDSSSTPLTAKVYIRNSSQTQDASGNENGYTFFCNLADATVIQGPQGPQGQQGPKGDTPVITTQAIAATSTMPAGTKITFTTGTGSTATSTSINVYNGKDGVSVSSATINASGELVFILSDASTINVGKIGGTGTGGCITMLGCFNTAPTIFAKDDVYYNTSDGLIYKSPDGTTWGTGTQPEKDILYISMDDHKIYSYTNNTFEVYGGNDTKISKEPFNTLSEKSDGLYAEPKGLGAAYRKETIIYDNPSLLSVKPNDVLTLSDDITNYDSIFICTGSDINNADTRKIHEVKLNDVDYVNDNQYKYGLDFCYNTTYYYSIRFKFTDSKSIKISSVIVGGWTGTTIIQIVGVKYTTDVSQLVDSSKAIEDTPVGSIVNYSGINIPTHYLPCGGGIYNIVDYPYLAQWMKDQFGIYNAFGGDGITTFAVPDKGGIYLTDPGLIQDVTKDGTPFSNTGTYSGYTLADAFTYSNSNSWFSYDNQNIFPLSKMPHIGYKFNETKYVSKIILRNMEYNSVWRCVDYIIQGSNDGTNWDELYVGTALPEDTLDHEIALTKCGFYTQYRLVFTKAPKDGTNYNWGIGKIKFLGSSMNKSIIKAEPTYYMELNQDAYINQYCDTYSTDEKIVGKWTNGKPIYRKILTYTNTFMLSNTTVDIPHNVTNFDSVVNVSGFSKAVTGEYFTWPVGTAGSSAGTICIGKVDSTNLQLRLGGQNLGANAVSTIIFEYTKTTDAPNSFDYGMIINQFAQEALLDVAVTDAEVDKCFE